MAQFRFRYQSFLTTYTVYDLFLALVYRGIPQHCFFILLLRHLITQILCQDQLINYYLLQINVEKKLNNALYYIR